MTTRWKAKQRKKRAKKVTRQWKRCEFYSSAEWKKVRYAALKRHGGRCQLCGASAADGTRLNVDHIKPVRRYPHLALVLDNLQVLCASCNRGKGHRDETDWRVPWERFESF